MNKVNKVNFLLNAALTLIIKESADPPYSQLGLRQPTIPYDGVCTKCSSNGN